MKSLLVGMIGVLFLLAPVKAQFIGQWYGNPSPVYQTACGPITPPWIFAHGSNHLGGNIIIRGVSREHWYSWCPLRPHSFLMILALGWNATNQILPAAITGYADAPILCDWDAVGHGLHPDAGSAEHYHMFQLPTDPSYIGVDFHAQWGMCFIDPAYGQWRIMTSEGLRIVIEQ